MFPTSVSIASAVPEHSLLFAVTVVSTRTSGFAEAGPTTTVLGSVSAHCPLGKEKYRDTVLLVCCAETVLPVSNLELSTPSSI